MNWLVDVRWTGYSYARINVKASSKEEAKKTVEKMRDDNSLSTFDHAWEEIGVGDMNRNGIMDHCDESHIEIGRIAPVPSKKGSSNG